MGRCTDSTWQRHLVTQATTVVNATKKRSVIYHPVAYTNGLFRGSQLNLAALTKEAYAIYLSVQKLSFYITNADVLIRSDHLPLRKFLNKNTKNAKVNNWAVELKTYNLKFVYIQDVKNTLAGTLSRLMEIDPDVAQPAEQLCCSIFGPHQCCMCSNLFGASQPQISSLKVLYVL